MSQIPEPNETMHAAAENQTIREWVDAAERREAARLGVKRPFARAWLARNWGVSFSTLTNFRRGRLKDLRSATRDRIQVGIIHGIEHEIQRLEHELVVVRQCGPRLSETQISQASAALEQARGFLKGK
jgi:hypothetical protein